MIAVMKLKDNKLSLLFMTNLGSVVKSRDHLADKDPCSWRCGFSSSHVQMWELGHKEDWALKNWCFWIVVLEKTLENPLDNKEIKPVNNKGSQPLIFFGRADGKVKSPRIWSYDAKSLLIGKDPDARKDWGQGKKGTTEDETEGWHHWFNRSEFEQTLGNSEEQGSLVCCSPWGHKESTWLRDWTTITT